MTTISQYLTYAETALAAYGVGLIAQTRVTWVID